MEQEFILPINQKLNQQSQMRTSIGILFLLIAGFISTFVSGYVISSYNNSSSITQNKTNTPTPTPTDTVEKETDTSTSFTPGSFYFEDTIMAVSKTEPRIHVIATVSRLQQKETYIHNTRISFFDGKDWTRKTFASTHLDSTIRPNTLIQNWDITLDPSRVLKQSAASSFTIQAKTISLTTNTLENEIGIRSLPGYTKFMSSGEGKLTVDGQPIPVNLVYTRIYSLNAEEIQFYDQSFGVTTDFVVFWDTNGTFYHIDATHVDVPTPMYQTHEIGVIREKDSTVRKTFSIDVLRDQENPPASYTVHMNTPLQTTLQFTRTNGLNKAPDNSYTWYMGSIEGSVKTNNGSVIPGYGIIEYIHS